MWTSNPLFDSNKAISLDSVVLDSNTIVQNILKPVTVRLSAPLYHGRTRLIVNQNSYLVGKSTNIVHSDELKCSEHNDSDHEKHHFSFKYPLLCHPTEPFDCDDFRIEVDGGRMCHPLLSDEQPNRRDSEQLWWK
ncbi:hypothetical protein BLNAU_16500 [Blattamonas nauphoetae]|uniref:Uncharacterized protein n=1 Tax=Blattamonas nauphoetae TaxID=2049346 RepID=A0ABQ9X9J8_9EUKA|nr:hypothetical protein BLNAU_16500 [Blattamonas nauphoetae]